MEREPNEEVEWQESEKPAGHGDPLRERAPSGDREDGASPSASYGDMDQPGMNPDLDDAVS